VEPYVKKMIEERTGPSYILKESARAAWDFARLIKNLPRRANNILVKAEKGTMKFDLEHRGFEALVEELDVTSNRLSFSLIISALIVVRPSLSRQVCPPYIWSAASWYFWIFPCRGSRIRAGHLYLRSGKW